MTIVKITSRRDSTKVLFECDVHEEIASGLALRHALEKAAASKTDLRGAYLRGAYLRGAYLSGAYLSDAYLRDADLSGADLSGAYLSGAYLSGADLSDAYLRDADLSGADLSGAGLRGADLRDAYLSGADLSDAYLRDADLSGADLSGADGAATPERSIENLDRVRAIVLDNAERLDMGHWHETQEWRNRTCAEETLCETTHCLAGWLQVCSTDDKVRDLDAQTAGIMCAPIAAKMFFRGGEEVLGWLKDRKYVDDLAERARRDQERAAKKAVIARAQGDA